MHKTIRDWLVLLCSITLLMPLAANAEQAMDFGRYKVHYSALQTSFLSPKVSRDYGIGRSRNRIMVNIAVQEKVGPNKTKPIIATVKVTATNLTGQLKNIKMRPIHDRDVIYYIGELNVAHGETLNFHVEVTPENSKQTLTFNFRQQFFTR